MQVNEKIKVNWKFHQVTHALLCSTGGLATVDGPMWLHIGERNQRHQLGRPYICCKAYTNKVSSDSWHAEIGGLFHGLVLTLRSCTDRPTGRLERGGGSHQKCGRLVYQAYNNDGVRGALKCWKREKRGQKRRGTCCLFFGSFYRLGRTQSLSPHETFRH